MPAASSTLGEASAERDSPRRLAAIAFADVVGYSILMAEDEARTHRRWMALLNEVVRPGAEGHRGRLVKSTGDGVLAEFPSALDAVEWAREVQEAVHRAGLAEGAEQRPLALRISVHIGDVMTTADDIYGDGVNVAARLQEYGEPGGVILSGAAHDLVRGAVGAQTRDLGFLRLKNFEKPVRAYALGGQGSAVTRPRWLRSPRPSIAVLPFVEHGVPSEHSYFGDGIVEDIIGGLASLRDLFVISRNSTLKYRQCPADLTLVGNELGVRYILSGSVRRVHNQVRIAVELADTETLGVLWADRVSGDFADLFTVQDRLTERVIQTIAPNIYDAEIRRVARKRPESLDAYDCMLRGLDLLYRLTRQEFDRAQEMFQKSIELDEDYAVPYALTALWHSIRINQGWSPDPRQDSAAVETFAAAALERDPLDVWALSLSGHLRALLLRDFDGALALFDRAIHASPNSAFAWARSSPTFCYMGNGAEARRRAEEALRLSPFDSQIFFTHAALGHAAYTQGDYGNAVAWSRQAYAENPRYTANLRFLVASLAAAGSHEDAHHVSRALLQLEPAFRVRKFCEGYAYRDPQRRENLARHLLLAGLPE
ncbi:MAG TPA: adenylate/guanylate cyclase domain-containing protein [Stellaceae bacterium]|nr:adenylate/guanylate cyclase domain-containing protein [Stellaceae bacterium]